MVGVGIFIHPPLVLWFCGNKYLALCMWFVGGLITALRFVVDNTIIQTTLTVTTSFAVYIDYGTAWPYNGGEVLYVVPTLY
jgi:hypothetical protein